MKSNLQTSNCFDFFKCDVLELLGCDIQATLKKKTLKDLTLPSFLMTCTLHLVGKLSTS